MKFQSLDGHLGLPELSEEEIDECETMSDYCPARQGNQVLCGGLCRGISPKACRLMGTGETYGYGRD